MQQQPWQFPDHCPLQGQFVTLQPLDAARDGAALYAVSHGNPEKAAVWHFMLYGPFTSPAAMQDWLKQEMSDRPDLLTWTIFDHASNSPVGMAALSAIAPQHGRAEIGHVWLTPSVQKSNVNTEAQFLLLQHLFDRHGYRRVQWKCDALNHASRSAATRMGFIYEGRFRRHMVVRGKNRDTDWFAMTDQEWGRCKANFEKWLYSGEKLSLMDLNHN